MLSFAAALLLLRPEARPSGRIIVDYAGVCLLTCCHDFVQTVKASPANVIQLLGHLVSACRAAAEQIGKKPVCTSSMQAWKVRQNEEARHGEAEPHF